MTFSKLFGPPHPLYSENRKQFPRWQSGWEIKLLTPQSVELKNALIVVLYLVRLRSWI
jgi:hypothetical protein